MRSDRGLTQDATASQKNMKSCTIPPGLTAIMLHIPRKAESFSSLSRMFRSDIHLEIATDVIVYAIKHTAVSLFQDLNYFMIKITDKSIRLRDANKFKNNNDHSNNKTMLIKSKGIN